MAIEQIEPIGNYILISKIEEENISESGLILGVGTPSENKGLVKAVGEKVNTDKDSTPINVGDTVLYSPGAEVKISNSEDSDVLISVKNVIGLVRFKGDD